MKTNYGDKDNFPGLSGGGVQVSVLGINLLYPPGLDPGTKPGTYPARARSGRRSRPGRRSGALTSRRAR